MKTDYTEEELLEMYYQKEIMKRLEELRNNNEAILHEVEEMCNLYLND